MDVVDFLILLFIVLIIGSVFAFGFNARGPWGSIWVFMLILLLAGFAGALWITPTGPVYWGFAWIPIVFFITFIALILAAATPGGRHHTVIRAKRPAPEKTDPEREEEAAAIFGVFFWVLIIFLIIAIAAGLFI